MCPVVYNFLYIKYFVLMRYVALGKLGKRQRELAVAQIFVTRITIDNLSPLFASFMLIYAYL